MDANPFERTMIPPDEDRDGPVFDRHRAGRIGAPHLVRTRCRDRAVVDSWADDAWGSAGGKRLACRMSRSTRAFEVRIPRARNRAQTLRWPSPRNGEVASTCRICSVKTASVYKVLGPRLMGVAGGVSARVRC